MSYKFWVVRSRFGVLSSRYVELRCQNAIQVETYTWYERGTNKVSVWSLCILLKS